MENRVKPLKQISLEEALNYVPVLEDYSNSPACFYTIEPSNDPKFPSEEGWEHITYYTARSKIKPKMEGDPTEIIYVMSNPSIPGLLKIGYTSRSSEERRVELSKMTAAPTPFKVEYEEFKYTRGMDMEREIHNFLGHKRVRVGEKGLRNKEFFDVTLDEAIEAIKKVGENYI